jgi:hypothetical protein
LAWLASKIILGGRRGCGLGLPLGGLKIQTLFEDVHLSQHLATALAGQLGGLKRPFHLCILIVQFAFLTILSRTFTWAEKAILNPTLFHSITNLNHVPKQPLNTDRYANPQPQA